MKRLFDIVSSFLVLLILSPLLILIFFLVRRDGGPALFKQIRVGKGGNEFKIYKFRSMVVNASELGGYSTQVGDPRITRIGKFIRKTSVDELPQLINVLLGDMSVVGPRPNVPAQRTEYQEAEWNKRNSVPPGITGLAQAKLRSLASADERTRLDLEYVDQQSFWLDLKIIFLTVRQILTKGGV